MKKILTLILICFIFLANAQTGMLNGTGYAPDISVIDINGNTHNLYSYLNSDKVVVLELMSTTCGHCQQYAAGTENSYQVYGPNGLDVAEFIALEVNAATSDNDLANFATTYGVSFPMCNGISPTAINYQLYYTPSYYVIYPDSSYVTFCPAYCQTTSSSSTIENLLNNAVQAWLPPVYGCTDPLASNYDSTATNDDGSCDYTSYTIKTLGSTFSPDTIICDVGDTINFILGGYHNAVEVSNSTWLAGGTTSNGGFSFGFGATGQFISTTAQTYYYVCQTHVTSGMKGIIIANAVAINGCTDTLATNYNASANTDDGSCIIPFSGAIGDTYQGGIVFWLDGNGGGLISAPTDQSTGAEWGCYGTVVSGADGTVIGTGAQNTIDIVNNNCSPNTAGNSIAADICDTLTIGGYSDWFLPSKYELNEMYQNIGQGNVLGLGNVGGFASYYYWSSTEGNYDYAWQKYFYSGGQGATYKYNTFYVRAVRAFGGISIFGCTDSTATNFNALATIDDGSCIYPCLLDEVTLNLYDNYNDGWNGNSLTVAGVDYTITCGGWSGCPASFNLCVDLSTCDTAVYNATGSWSYENSWNIVDASGAVIAFGGDYSAAYGNCSIPVYGCTDSTALNYDPLATVDDSSCTYVPSSCASPSPTGAYISELIHDRVRVNWDNMNDTNCMVTQYRIRYRELGTSTWLSKTMANSGLCLFGLNTTSKKVVGLTPSTTYEYYMKAWYCGGGVSAWSATQNFTTADECENVINFAVSTPTTTKASFSWDSTSAYSFARIKLRVDTTGDVWTSAGGFGVFYPALTKEKNGLTPGTSYRAQARTWCDPTGGAYRSATWSPLVFWTQPTSIRLEGGSSINNLFIYPNPSRDIFNVSFISENVQNLEVRVLNIVGAVIYTENLEQFIGEYTKAIDLATYTKGVYFLEITTNNGVVNKKLILQ